MEGLLTADAIIALITLTVLEIVLGVDNVIFISILAGKLPADQQDRARTVGLMAAMVMRIAAAVLAGLDRPAHRAAVHDSRAAASRAAT